MIERTGRGDDLKASRMDAVKQMKAESAPLLDGKGLPAFLADCTVVVTHVPRTPRPPRHVCWVASSKEVGCAMSVEESSRSCDADLSRAVVTRRDITSGVRAEAYCCEIEQVSHPVV